MRTSVIILLALCSCSFASPQEVFIYSQNGEKHYFQTVDSLIQVQFKDGTNKDKMLSVARSIDPLIGDIDISNSNKVIIHYYNKLIDFERISNDSSLVYANKSLLYSDGAIQIPTNKVMVKIKIGYSLPDLLTQMKIDYKSFRRIGHNGNAYIIYLNNGESIKVANYLYESNYFESSQPSFARFMETSNTHFDDQWGLINTGQNDGTEGIDINVYDAWDITEGNENISIAVLDDGVDLDHPDLEDNLRTGYDATEDGGNLVGDCFNVDAHGTACAGIISAIDNTIGIKGVAPYCEIIPIRMHYTNTYSQLYSEEEWIIDAINHAWDDAEADILSCSWEINGSRIDLVEDEIDFALENGRDNQGCVVVFASGNDNSSSIDYPADYNSDIIAVGAMSPCGERKSATSCDDEDWPNNGGSNYGDELDLIAPGVFIPTTDIQGSFGYNTTVGSSGDYHLDFWGTSAATPHVAGVAALVLSANPNLSQDQVRDILESTAQKVGSYSYSTTNGRTNGTWSNRVGYGLVDAYESVLAAAGGPISGPELVCSTGSSFSISPPVAYDSILWSNGLSLNITSGQGTTSCSFSSTGDGNSYIRVKLYFNGDSITLPDKIVWSGKPYVNPSSIQFECADGTGYFCSNAFGNEFSFTFDHQFNYFDIKLTNLSETQTFAQFRIYGTWGTMDCSPPDGTYLFQVRGNNDCGTATNWTKEAVDFVDCGMGGLFSLDIYPNPATEQATITIGSTKDKDAITKKLDEEWQLEVYTQGQLLKHSVPAIVDNKYILNTSGWKPGMYFIRAYYKDEVVFGTLVVNK